MDSTAGNELLSFMDAYSGYNQIRMHPNDQELTSFITSQGLYYYNVMPLGLKNAGATYQRLVNAMFCDQIEKTMEIYIDDTLVKCRHAENHISHLTKAFDTLQQYQLKLNPAKCVFGASTGKFLGFLVSQRGIEADPDQIIALLQMRTPQSRKDVQCLMGD